MLVYAQCDYLREFIHPQELTGGDSNIAAHIRLTELNGI
jgi:hypothetical protein